jgi:hypothetical protein
LRIALCVEDKQEKLDVKKKDAANMTFIGLMLWCPTLDPAIRGSDTSLRPLLASTLVSTIVPWDSVTRFFASGFFPESVSPQPQGIPLGLFQILGDIRKSRCTTTGGKFFHKFL